MEMQIFENEVLDIAHNRLDLISSIEMSHLEKLKEDRNRCAHPTFSEGNGQFTPLPELARSHIVHAANYLLILPPVIGRVIVSRVESLILESSFPENDEDASVLLSSNSYLGRVRSSCISSLVNVLIMTLFDQVEEPSEGQVNRISAALGAIEKIQPETYRTTVDGTLNRVLSRTGEHRLKLVFLLLIRRPCLWNKIDEALKVRIYGLVPLMDIDELIKYRLCRLASIISPIESVLQRRVGSLNEGDVRKLLRATPEKTLKKYAIEIFVESGSFEAAYQNGIIYIVPFGEYLDKDDLKDMFDGVFNNTLYSSKINQILKAGGIDEVFGKLYLATKNSLDNDSHREIWKGFWSKAMDGKFELDALKAFLISDKLIEDNIEEDA